MFLALYLHNKNIDNFEARLQTAVWLHLIWGAIWLYLVILKKKNFINLFIFV